MVRAFEEFARNPRPGEVYNLGGGRENSVSVLEAIALVEEMTGARLFTDYREQPRKADHICYISNLHKLKSHYPEWKMTRNLPAFWKRWFRGKRADPRRATGLRAPFAAAMK